MSNDTPDDIELKPFNIDDIETRKAETGRKPRQFPHPKAIKPKGSPKPLKHPYTGKKRGRKSKPKEPPGELMPVIDNHWDKATEKSPTAKDGTKRGRPKGAGTKSGRLLADAQDMICRKFGIKNFDPVIMLMMIAADETNDKALRVTAVSKAAPYIHSTLRQIEVKGDEDNPINVNVMTAKDQLARMLKDIEVEVIKEIILEDPEDNDEDEDDIPLLPAPEEHP